MNYLVYIISEYLSAHRYKLIESDSWSPAGGVIPGAVADDSSV